jgi:PAS domain-containing protein
MNQRLPSPLPPAVAAAIQQRFDDSPISTQVFNLDGWTVYVNAAWERFFQAPREVASLFNILHDQQLSASGMLPRIRAAFSGEIVRLPAVPFESSKTVVRGQQPRQWIDAFFFPIRDASGALVGVAVQHRDVSAEYGERDAG